MKDLTARQKETLQIIRDFTNRHSYPPTIREIAAGLGISTKGAYDHVKALEKKGWIRYDPNRSRTLEIIEEEAGASPKETLEVPILGNVAAGTPLFAEENLEGYLTLPAENLGNGTHFALHIQGDSMRDAGILNGDLAILKQQAHADNGDIVVAMVNDEAVTLKRFYKETHRVRLKAENPAYPPIYTQNARIIGKLRYIVRSYE